MSEASDYRRGGTRVVKPRSMKTVSISTDGLRDFVTMPDGLKYMVGQVGMAKLVAECARNGPDARRALNEYLKRGEATIALDLDRLAELTAPPKARWTLANSSFVPPHDRASTTASGRPIMDRTAQIDTSEADKAIQKAISNQCFRIEQQIALISQHAGEASPGSIGQNMQKDQVDKLRDLVTWLRRGSPYGNQSKNDTYYGLPEKLPSGEPARSKNDVKLATDGSLASLSENGLLADATLSKIEAASTKIDLLVKSGKKFDHVKAKGDLYKVASSVQALLKDADLAAPWVKGELTKFADEAKRLHGLFAPAKV
jgi:hypothetical protein